jgi:amidase
MAASAATSTERAPAATASGAEQLEALRRGDLSSEELTRTYLERINQFDSDLNAVVTVDEQGALADARERDRERAEVHERGPLHGLPITIKDSFEVAGVCSTAGIRALRDYVPAVDAEAVARLRSAGAVILGKTNIPTANADFQTSNPVYGVTNNPWDLERTPGGSAGGGAAAVAAGLSAIDFGSEIGGSLRLPAHFTGIYGHKSSTRTIPLGGHLPPGPKSPRRYSVDTDLVAAGGQARGAKDLELLLRAVAGAPDLEAACWRLEFPEPRSRELEGFRIGAWLEDPFAPLDGEVEAALERAVAELEAAGARIDRSPAIPSPLAESHRIFETLLYGAFAEDRSTFSAKGAAYMWRAMAVQPLGHPWRVWRWLLQSHRNWIGVYGRAMRLRHEWSRFFRSFDVVLMPVSPTPALPHHRKDHDRFGRTYLVNGKRRRYDEQPAWNGVANLAGCPATVLPAGQSRSGLPVGIQAMGPLGEDLTTIEFAKLAGDVLGAYAPPPGYSEKPGGTG